MATRSRLGRGLGSLLSMTDPVSAEVATPADPSAPPSDTVTNSAVSSPLSVPVDAIDVNPHQPRRDFDEAALATLADSIRANGVIQPIVVRPLPDGRYELIAGERRLRAAKLARQTDIPVIVRDVDAYTQAQWALVENIHREDLNPLDRAEAYAALMQQLGLTQAELAGRLGEQRSSVANYLRLLELDPTLRDDVRRGVLTLGHAKVLAGLPVWEQLRLADLVRDQHLSVRNLERMAEKLPTDAPPPSDPAGSPDAGRRHLDEVEQQIVQQLGCRVQLRSGKKPGAGRVIIHYPSLEKFDELMRRCGVVLADS